MSQSTQKSTICLTFLEKFTKSDVFFRSCDLTFIFFSLLSKMLQGISTLLVTLSFNEISCSSTFFVELHLDDVLEVLLEVGFDFKKIVDKYHRKIHRKKYDNCLINGEIYLFKLWNKRSYRSFKIFDFETFGNFTHISCSKIVSKCVYILIRLKYNMKKTRFKTYTL